jgi:golgi phosphoprotein 3
MDRRMLNLSEKVFILSLNDENGAVHRSAAIYLPYIIAGALLADLTLLGKIHLDQDKQLSVVSSQPCEEPILDFAFQAILKKDRPHGMPYWIDHFSVKPQAIQEKIITSLTEKGIVTQEKKRILWVVPTQVYPIHNASAKYAIKLQLREMILTDVEPDSRGIILLGLMDTCNLLDLIFTKDERKAAVRKIKEFANSEIISQVFQQAIHDIFLAAIMAPAIK